MPTAGELCNRTVVIAKRNETVRVAAQRMLDRHVGSVVVVDEVDGRRVPVGIVTDRDIVLAVVAAGRDPNGTLVEDVMSTDLVKAWEDDDAADAFKRMRSYGVRRLPVVNDDDGLEGIVAFDDVLEFLAEQIADMATLLSREQRREREREDMSPVPT